MLKRNLLASSAVFFLVIVGVTLARPRQAFALETGSTTAEAEGSVLALFASLRRLFFGSTEVLSPLIVERSGGINPQPTPVYSEGGLSDSVENVGSGGSPTETADEDSARLGLASSSAGEVWGAKIDRAAKEVSSWTADSNVLIGLIVAAVFVGLIIILMVCLISRNFRGHPATEER